VSEHDEVYERAQRQGDELEEQKDRLSKHIDETRKDWESKKSDESVPGARPEDEPEERDRADEDGPPPEADAITPGD
jgi:hypothetical protein